ncbi:MAG TPA: hypothetical protein PL066_03805 [bacterium]|nr:hypothetical protein [bacterium]
MAADPQVLELGKVLSPFLIGAIIFGLLIAPFLEDKADSANRWLNGKSSRRKRK